MGGNQLSFESKIGHWNSSYSQSKQFAHEHRLMRQCTERRMAMNDLNAFTQQNVSQQRDVAHHGWENALIVERADWQIIDFETFGQITHPFSILIRMGDDDNLQNNKEIKSV